MGRRVASLGPVPAAWAALILALIAALFAIRPRPIPPPMHPTPVSVTLLHALAAAAVHSGDSIAPAHRFASVPHAPILQGSRGLPRVIYLGAEFCPYCASERWAVIIALDRFGAFASLNLAWSASDDIYPNTATFTFHNAVYRSAYIDFTPVETEANYKVDGQYARLDPLSVADTRLARTYNAPPYVPAYLAGAIPFVDIANQFVATGGLDPRLLRGQPQATIVARLADASAPATRAILAGADEITAAICTVTGNIPSNICGHPYRLMARQP